MMPSANEVKPAVSSNVTAIAAHESDHSRLSIWRMFGVVGLGKALIELPGITPREGYTGT